MWLITIGLALLGAWYFEVGSFGELAWYWVLMPFLLAFFWFEWGERATGWDKRKRRKEADADAARKERIRQQFMNPGSGKRAR